MMLIQLRTEKLTDVGLGAWTEPLAIAAEQIALLALPSLAPVPPALRFAALWACRGPAADPRLSGMLTNLQATVDLTPSRRMAIKL
jgi:hypothetical protein